MACAAESCSLWSYVADLAHEACQQRRVPEGLAHHARTVTLRNLSCLGEAELDAASRARVRAYFRSVVRRASARSSVPGAREYRLEMIAASLAADLKESGADDERVSREVAAWLETQTDGSLSAAG